MKTRTRIGVLLAVIAALLVGIVGPAQAAIDTTEVFYFCDVYQNRSPSPGIWQGHISLFVAWETNDNASPAPPYQAHVNAGYDPPGPVGPGIQIWNYTDHDVDITDVSYWSDAGLYGQYQGNDIFLAGNGGHSGVKITNALWNNHPPSHWLPWLNDPFIRISVIPHNQPTLPPFYNTKFCSNYVPSNIPV